MKIVVFSDSHTDVDTMLAVAQSQRPDVVLHLGDCVADGLDLKSRIDMPVYFVKGSIDETDVINDEELLAFENTRVYMTHGHNYDVEAGLAAMYGRVAGTDAHIALFGHTHTPHLGYVGGVWYMNPGRIGRRSSKVIHATYGIIRLGSNKISCGICEVGP